jgi:hypothetical protein
MEVKHRCIFCDNVLDGTTKPEHILLNALGGRKTTRKVICSDCNNRFGGTIDDALSAQVPIIRNLLQFESGTGKSPPMLRSLQSGKEKINIKSDGRPELVAPPFSVTKRPDGSAEIRVMAQSEDEFKRILPHIAGQLGITQEQLAEQMANTELGIVERRPDTVHHRISLGGPDALRSVVKSCLVLLATVAGNQALKTSVFLAAREFVANGSEEFNKARICIDSRDVPNTEMLKRDYGSFYNLIYVRSDASGRVIGHFTLYNIISWQIVLAESGGPIERKIGLVSNPLDPVTWSDSIANDADIPFDWLNTEDRAYELERARERLITMAKHHHNQSLEAEIGRIVNDVCAKHGIHNEHDAIDPAKLKDIYAEAIARLGAHAAGLPYEQKLSPEDLKRLLSSQEQR